MEDRSDMTTVSSDRRRPRKRDSRKRDSRKLSGNIKTVKSNSIDLHNVTPAKQQCCQLEDRSDMTSVSSNRRRPRKIREPSTASPAKKLSNTT